ncbi:mediator of RNA polymerase II transcription subunit 11-like [Stylophora pistillata]|uniref:Mediator of RNA polymerase II transcription subunit 11 n=1 Tax=Stylophora pistillata TaxID=50429 RepID=A0A2B4SED9_STYPI|nr:mediator of RNA polymerase II transcription subunit 11-like [Stylophora pistillata]PFX29044.1 Mediator of RNA polymerase II transcription subunit 11 [Stylophora pistillata]
MSQSGDRLKQLEEIEKDVVKVIRSAGETLEELSKDAPSEDRINSTATKFLKSLEGVEKGLTEQIGYLTQVATGQPHEGSTYGAEKDFELLRCRTKAIKDQLVEIQHQGTHQVSDMN